MATAMLRIALFALLALPLVAQEKPNFVVIFADDLGYGDLSSYGATAHKTPVLDRMAEQGIRFTDFYVPMPFCAPSRASLLTGRYPFRNGMMTNPAPDAGINDVALAQDEVTFAESLKPLGYATAAIGKWHLGHVEGTLPRTQGFDEYFGILYSNDMRPVQLIENESVAEYPVPQSTLTRRYTDRALDFIERNRNKPFCLYLPHAMPHKPLAASEDFYTPDTPGDLYSDVIRELDASVGDILAKLKELNLDEKTLVVFTSDNGPWFGGSTAGLRGMKGRPWDGGIRVPMIARWPGKIPAGRVSKAVISSVDLFPTLLAAAGAGAPKGRTIDGKDLLPLLTGKTEESPHEAIVAMRGQRLHMVRSGRWKLHVRAPQSQPAYQEDVANWVDPRAPDGVTILAQFEQAKPNQFPGSIAGVAARPMMLFDLETDPSEREDVSAEHPEVVARLKAFFDRLDALVPEPAPPGPPRSGGVMHLHGGELRYDLLIEPKR